MARKQLAGVCKARTVRDSMAGQPKNLITRTGEMVYLTPREIRIVSLLSRDVGDERLFREPMAVWKIACELGAAKAASLDAILSSLAFAAEVTTAARATVPAWRRHVGNLALWLSGLSHPLLGLRCAIIRARWPLAAGPAEN